MTLRRTYIAFLAGFAIWFLPLSVMGEEVAARARVDSTSYLVGDWITVRIDLTHPKGSVFRRMSGDTLGAFSVIRRDSLERLSETHTATQVVVAKYDSGTAVLPPIPFLYTVTGDTASHVVATNPLILTVHTVRVDTTKDIRDIKPPLSIPLTLAEIALALGVILVLAVLGYQLYRYWKRRKQRQPGETYVPPPRAAHLIALEELALLKEKRLWQQGLTKQYYSEVTEIVRRYFENRFGIKALEETTGEIMSALRSQHHAEAVREETELILRRADLVKFAKYQPDISQHEEMMSVAFDIVGKTKVVETMPVTGSEKKAMTHVVS